MKRRVEILFVALVWMIATSVTSEAQVRGAASKALGDYGHSESSGFSGRTTYANPGPQVSTQSAAVVQPDSSTRAFSYDKKSAEPSKVANQPAPSRGSSEQAARSSSTRSFSYQAPSMAPRQGLSAPRGWQIGVRDASSKVRGEY